MPQVSIVIPALSETDNIAELIVRIDAAFNHDRDSYEIIFIDDKPASGTLKEITKYQMGFPISIYIKKGEPGRIKFLQERFGHSNYGFIAMMDANLRYPPEAIPKMLNQLIQGNLDIVVASCEAPHRPFIYRSMDNIYKLFSEKILFNLRVDTLSGLKLFRKEILERIDINIVPGMFDLNFLFHARSAGYQLASHNITIKNGAKVNNRLLQSRHFLSLMKSVINLRISPPNYVRFDQKSIEDIGLGFHYKGKPYITHNTLARNESAVERTTLSQRIIILTLLFVIVIFALIKPITVLIVIVSLFTILYFCDLLFNLFLIYRSLRSYSEIVIDDETAKRKRSWPIYTILCPLYKEVLVVPQFITAMKALDYPKDKLEVLLLLEEDDHATVDKIKSMRLPSFFKIIVLPDALPKTKPKACNYGLIQATGQYSVIYDAEDIPEPLQLKKAVLAFESSNELIGCIQAKLNYYNWDQNLLTRLFTLEYSLWFNLILTGLQSIKAPIPLGGTSNHFRTKVLQDLGGWDPFNVTEDADLGIRLAKRGLKTAVLDSTTLEEANSAYGNWFKQRSRWIKGYIQTYLVHTRNLREFGQKSRSIDAITFQLVIGGKVLSMLINPVLWIMTISYFAFRAEIGPFIQSLYLTPIFYLGAISLVIGNFLYVYYYMMGAARQGRPELIVFALFVPAYWAMMSMAAFYAIRDLIVRPFHWHKTKHGLHLDKLPVEKLAS